MSACYVTTANMVFMQFPSLTRTAFDAKVKMTAQEYKAKENKGIFTTKKPLFLLNQLNIFKNCSNQTKTRSGAPI